MKSIANEIITRGWTRGRLVDRDTGRVCLMGAIDRAAEGQGFALIQATLRAIMESKKGWTGFGITAFNDAATTSYDDVLRVAKRADEILGSSSCDSRWCPTSGSWR